MTLAALLFDHTPSAGMIASALVGVALLTLYSAWRTTGLRGPAWIGWALRVAFLAALGWCLLLPYEKDVTRERIKPKLLIALDTSASMDLRAKPDLPSRLEAARAILAQPWMDLARARYDIEACAFDREAGPHQEPAVLATLPAQGGASHIRDALRRITNRVKGQPLAGVLLLTDGLDTRETGPDWTRETWPAPVLTARLEPENVWGVEADVRVDSLSTPKRVTAGWNSKLEVSLSGQAARGTDVRVQLVRDNDVLRELPVSLPEEGATRQVAFDLEHPQVGRFRYTVRIPALPGERNLTDNEMSTDVLVTDARNRVVYVEHVPRWESKYLNRALSAVPNITPIGFLKGPGGRFITYGNRGNTDLVLTREQMDFIKVVILGDLSAEALGEERAKQLLSYVETGGSLLLLGGPEGWGASGFAASALRPLLPVSGVAAAKEAT